MKFKILLNNPELLTNAYQIVKSNYLTELLDFPLYLPNLTDKLPFVFSCFASSIDGKLCYPDLRSGFTIAKNNFLATKDERFADWWNLCLGRTISDAVLIGSNSIISENYEYKAQINIPELVELRKQLGKPENLLHIVITRDLNKINFHEELICKANNIPTIIFTKNKPESKITNFKVSQLQDINVLSHKQIIYDQNFSITDLLKLLNFLGIKIVLNESPFYHHHLQELKILNETWLNTSGVYIGGNLTSLGLYNKAFTTSIHPHYSILTLHSIGYNFLYTRYKISY